MKKIFSALLLLIHLPVHSLSPNDMLVVIGAVKYYNENCQGLSHQGIKKMNKALRHFDMDETPIYILEQNFLAASSYQIASQLGCNGTKNEANKAGYGGYIN
ncbi:hypothetical protein [Candidatus Thioglobus sp.]|uniref:hypothetical protein n=1 Tax=Candidatus Thioglobus sp. TaxID=2026721 RepID=UPI003D0C7412